MKKWLSYLLVLGLFIAVVPAAQAENEITVNMNEDFESYEVGQKPEYSMQTHWMTDNGKGTIAVEEEEDNQYLALESITKADDVMLVMYQCDEFAGYDRFSDESPHRRYQRLEKIYAAGCGQKCISDF